MIRLKTLSVLAFALCLSSAYGAPAAAKAPATAPAEATTLSAELKGSDSRVEFLAIGRPSAIKIRGEAKPSAEAPPLSGQLLLVGNKVTGTAKVALDSFDTGIDLRNKHMKEKYLETAKYPEAELTIKKLDVPAAGGDFSVEKTPFEGELALHGQKKAVTGTANVERKGEKLKTAFDFKLALSDYNIAVPSFMGIKVADEVAVTASASAPLKKQALP